MGGEEGGDSEEGGELGEEGEEEGCTKKRRLIAFEPILLAGPILLAD